MTSIDTTEYTVAELKQAVDMDAYSVRNEAERRLSIVTKKLARLYAEEARLEKEQIMLGEAIEAAWTEIHK